MVCKHLLFFVDTPAEVPRGVLQKVAHLATALGADVEVFDCAFDPGLVETAKVQEAIERRRSELQPVVELLRAESVHAYASVSWAHPAREGVLRQIRRQKPDLLIIRTKKHARLARRLFTYSDYKLIETAPCPILVLKNDRSYEGARVIAAVDPMHTHDKPAELDEKIVDSSAAFARALGRPLHIYHACGFWPAALPSRSRLRDVPEAVYQDICGAYQAKSESRVRLLAESACVPERQVHIAMGDASVLLPQFVASGSCDLLVMGAVARSRLRRAMIGHTAERVLDETDCDVLIVKPPALQPAGRRSIAGGSQGRPATARSPGLRHLQTGS